MQIEAKLQALGLVLPAAPKAPPGIEVFVDLDTHARQSDLCVWSFSSSP